MPGLAPASDGLDPGEHFFDALAYALAQRISLARRQRVVDVGAPTRLVAGDVRRCPGGLAESNELGRVVALVGANGDPPPVRPASSIASAASRSASPVARLTSPSTTSP